jgi:diaminopimelate decarboxylase
MEITKDLLTATSCLYGDSFYFLDTVNFEDSFKSLTSEFQSFYPKSRIAYSYKTNYIPRLCKIVDTLGGYAETVSDMEVDVALAVGVDPKNIFFNGPYKKAKAIEDLLLKGGVVNADSDADLEVICSIAASNPQATLRVGIRCNFDIRDGVVSRFGFDFSNGDFDRALTKILKNLNIEMVGLHCHFASRGLQSWVNASKGMLDVIRAVEMKNIKPLKYVSLGGGLYGRMSPKLQQQLGISPPSFGDYAAVAAKSFAEFYKHHDEHETPELIIEPGTALAANALKFVAKVINIKIIGQKSIATLSGSSFNTNPTAGKINLPITVFHLDESESMERYEDMDMAGYTCIESDYLYRNYSGQLSVGDFVVFDSAGSYSIVMKPPFIMPNVPILEVNKDQTVRVIKRQETFEDIFRTYQMEF